MDMKHWLKQADRISAADDYTYKSLAADLAQGLGWTDALDVATALRGHVYGWPGTHALHQAVKPLYDRLGWEQSALLAAWFRDARNRPGSRHRRRAGGWPGPAPTTARTVETKEPSCPT